MKSNFFTNINVHCELTKFEDEAEIFILLKDSPNNGNILFSAWITESEINQNWDIISRNLTNELKRKLLAEIPKLKP